MFAILTIRISLAVLAGHQSDVQRTSANHYALGALDVATRDCTTTAELSSGEHARIVRGNAGHRWLAFRDDSGEADGTCEIASVHVAGLR